MTGMSETLDWTAAATPPATAFVVAVLLSAVIGLVAIEITISITEYIFRMFSGMSQMTSRDSAEETVFP